MLPQRLRWNRITRTNPFWTRKVDTATTKYEDLSRPLPRSNEEWHFSKHIRNLSRDFQKISQVVSVGDRASKCRDLICFLSGVCSRVRLLAPSLFAVGLVVLIFAPKANWADTSYPCLTQFRQRRRNPSVCIAWKWFGKKWLSLVQRQPGRILFQRKD